MKFNHILVIAFAFALSGCATWSTSSVSQPGTERAQRPARGAARAAIAKTDAATIALTENDITDKPYDSLGDIKVTVNKTTIFSKDPTREQVDAALREKASELGANAVVLVRYGTVGVSAFSWGSLDGQGRAIKFK